MMNTLLSLRMLLVLMLAWLVKTRLNQTLLANSPVVLARVVSLRGLTKSTWFASLAVVSAVGCSKPVWSKRRISLGSRRGDTSDSTILPGRISDLSSLSKEI